MDDDAFLYSFDDPELFEEEESDNDVLDDIDDERAHTEVDIVFAPASVVTKSGDEQEPHAEGILAGFDLIEKCHRAFTEKFGFSEYKGKQKEIIAAAMSGLDVFVLAPTGMGKSLCFQVPAIAEDCGVSVVVSPLLALMKNRNHISPCPALYRTNIPEEVAGLRKKGISAVSLTSETTKAEKSDIIRDLSSKRPKTRLFYTTPEKLCTQELMRTFTVVHSNRRLARLVIDEAHCISEWGHDFREEYRKLGSFRERFPGIPVMALTATATNNVQRDIIRSLKMVEEKLFTAVHPFNRTNLFYEVRYKSAPESLSMMQDILEFIESLHRRRDRPSSGIIYCRKRGMCDELSTYLRGKGLNARPYHRGINSKTLNKTLKEWEIGGSGKGGVDVVCATIAFGMGIDKSDVRYIIHYDLPKSMEGYYQETGRAGRDGQPSRCILYYSREDALRLQKLVANSHARRRDAACSNNGPQPSQRSIDSLGSLLSFAENVTTCRHVSICRYFGEVVDTTDDDVMESVCDKMCDVCKFPDRTRQRKTNLSEEDYAATVVSNLAWNTGYEDDDDSERQKSQREQPQPQLRANAPAGMSTGANTGQMTLLDCLNSAPGQGFKRPNAHGRDKLVMPNVKRAKLDHAKGEQSMTSASSSKATSTTAVRGSLPPPLITRPYSSVNRLTKPFKTPFKTPFKVPIEGQAKHDDLDRKPIERVSPAPPPPQKGEGEVDDVEIVEIQVRQEPPSPKNGSADNQGDVDVEIPKVELELEVSFSRKVPLETRTSTFDVFRKSLHRVFFLGDNDIDNSAWRALEKAPTSKEDRIFVLADAAKKLEHGIHIMSATPSGYETRVQQKQKAIASLVVEAGKGRANNSAQEEDHVGEIMDALRGAVEWWHRMQKE